MSVLILQAKFRSEVEHIAPIVEDKGDKHKYNHTSHYQHSEHSKNTQLFNNTSSGIEAECTPIKIHNNRGKNCWLDLGAEEDEVVEEKLLVYHAELEFTQSFT